jgi:hypothetical protein
MLFPVLILQVLLFCVFMLVVSTPITFTPAVAAAFALAGWVPWCRVATDTSMQCLVPG